jgi:ferrochelatase
MSAGSGARSPGDDSVAADAVIVVNTGTPAAPRSAAVRSFLARFLSDPRVVELPRMLWLPLLYTLVLPLRAPRSAHRYRLIWHSEGSPLAVHTGQLTHALAQQLAPLIPALQVQQAFLYSEPSFTAVLERLRTRGARRLLVLPLFPQRSGTTTGAVYDQLGHALRSWRALPQLRVVASYCEHPGYIGALAASVREHWAAHGRTQHLLMSFHGIPVACVRRGDDYPEQCRVTAERVAAELGLAAGDWSLSYQSRFGAARWLAPATVATLQALPQRGVRAVSVLCPGFPADCLETLEEIALGGRDVFLKAGGERFDYVPALNARADHAQALAQLLAAAGHDWRT